LTNAALGLRSFQGEGGRRTGSTDVWTGGDGGDAQLRRISSSFESIAMRGARIVIRPTLQSIPERRNLPGVDRVRLGLPGGLFRQGALIRQWPSRLYSMRRRPCFATNLLSARSIYDDLWTLPQSALMPARRSGSVVRHVRLVRRFIVG